MKGNVSKSEVDRFLKAFPKFEKRIQEEFAELYELYQKWPVTFNTKGRQTKFNLRYFTHPTTNLSEASAMNYMVLEGCPVQYVTDQPTQDLGVDFFYEREGQLVSVSVKLCSMFDRGLTFHHTVANSLFKDRSQEVFFIDNLHKRGVLIPMGLIQQALPRSRPSKYNKDRLMLFYDMIQVDKSKLEFFGDKNGKIRTN